MDNPKNKKTGSRSYAFLDPLLQREHSRSRSKDRQDFQLVPRKRNWMPGYGCADTRFPSTQRRGHGGWLTAALATPEGTPWHKPTFLQDRELWEASGPRAPWAGRIQVPELQALSPDCAVDNRPSLLRNSQSPCLSLKHKM